MAEDTAMFQAYNSNPQGMFILLLVGMIVPVILVILRFASRKIERVGWWWDDYLAGLSLLLFVGGFWADLQIVRWSSNEQGPFLIRVYINNVLYPLIVSTTKISGLLLYVLHFGYEKWPKRIAYTLMALVVCWCIAAVATSVVQCLPLAAAWTTPTNSPAQCFQRPLLFEAVGIADAAMNLLVLLLPLPKIFRLDLRSFGPVVSLLQVYVLALFTLACSVLRIYYAPHFQPFPSLSPSPTQSFTPLFLWTKLEESFGLQAICMPTAMPALLALFACSFEDPKERTWRKMHRSIGRDMLKGGFDKLNGRRRGGRGGGKERRLERIENGVGQWDLGREKAQAVKVAVYNVGDREYVMSDKVRKLREELYWEAMAKGKQPNTELMTRRIEPHKKAAPRWNEPQTHIYEPSPSADGSGLSAMDDLQQQLLKEICETKALPSPPLPSPGVASMNSAWTGGSSRGYWSPQVESYEMRAREGDMGLGIAI